MTGQDLDTRWLARAIELAVSNVGDGGGPFGAVVVRGGEVLATGVNRVTVDQDPTAHAEVQAIRAAAARAGDHSLSGSVLYTSCEPCPMCVAAALWARLDRVVYAADRTDAARAGFDDQVFHELAGTDPASWPTPLVAVPVPGDASPFDAWLARDGREPY